MQIQSNSYQSKLERNSSIELLRIILMLFVITLHYNGMCGHALEYCLHGVNFYFTRLTESICICAVNCFMIISGYFLSFNKEIKFKRILHILGIVIGINFFTELIGIIITKQFNLKSLIRCFLPENYFSTFYIITYILSPFINSIFDKLQEFKKTLIFIIILFVLFIIYPTIYDSAKAIFDFNLNGLDTINGAGAGNAGGYTIVNFIVMYCVGAFLRRFSFANPKKNIIISLSYLGSIICIFLNLLFIPQTALCYYNVFVVLNAIFLFLIFLQLNINNSVINYISKGTFGVFCLHVSSISNLLWNKFNIQNASSKTGCIILNTIISVLIMTTVCYACDLLLQIIINPIRKQLGKTRLYNKSISFDNTESGDNDELSKK